MTDFIYLDEQISNTGNCEKEIRRRIAMGKNDIAKLIWSDQDITEGTKMIISSFIFPIFYIRGCIMEHKIDRMDAFGLVYYVTSLVSDSSNEYEKETRHSTYGTIYDILKYSTLIIQIKNINRQLLDYFVCHCQMNKTRTFFGIIDLNR